MKCRGCHQSCIQAWKDVQLDQWWKKEWLYREDWAAMAIEYQLIYASTRLFRLMLSFPYSSRFNAANLSDPTFLANGPDLRSPCWMLLQFLAAWNPSLQLLPPIAGYNSLHVDAKNYPDHYWCTNCQFRYATLAFFRPYDPIYAAAGYLVSWSEFMRWETFAWEWSSEGHSWLRSFKMLQFSEFGKFHRSQKQWLRKSPNKRSWSLEPVRIAWLGRSIWIE